MVPARSVPGPIAKLVTKLNALRVLRVIVWSVGNVSNAKEAVLTVLLNHPQSALPVPLFFMGKLPKATANAWSVLHNATIALPPTRPTAPSATSSSTWIQLINAGRALKTV